MKLRSTWTIVLAVVVGLACGQAWGQIFRGPGGDIGPRPGQPGENNKDNGGGGNSGNNNNNTNNNQPPPSTVDPQLKADEDAQKQAEQDLSKATDALNAVVTKLKTNFEKTPDLIAAQQALADAEQALSDAQQKAIASLATNADYQAAMDAKKKATDDLSAARANGDATPDIMAPLASAMLDASSKVSKMEAEAETGDPDVQAAQAKVVTAKKALDQLEQKFQLSLATDPDYVAAKKVVDDDQKKVTDAQAKVTADRAPKNGNG